MRTAIGLIGLAILTALAVVQMKTADSQTPNHGALAILIISLIVLIGNV
jgi:hypothetical protein